MTRARLRLGLLIPLTLFVCAPARAADDPPIPAMAVSEYKARLDAIISQLSSTDGDTSEAVSTQILALPSKWRVDGTDQIFDIPTRALRREGEMWRKTRNDSMRTTLLDHVRALRAEADTFEGPPVDTSSQRALLAEILSGSEFKNLSGPGWSNWLLQRFLEMLRWLFGGLPSTVIPTIGRALVYILGGIAFVILAVYAQRFLRDHARRETRLSIAAPIPAKAWAAWLAEAEAAASRGHWRDAVHLTYWCAVSFLEANGAWRPDRARTPREYLRLLSAGNERTTLSALTRRFELVWYGAEDADAKAFADSIADLKRMGCPAA